MRQLLDADDAEYRQYFLAFDAGAHDLAAMLARARRDRYWGIRAEGRLVGFLMLRGLDEGYTTPAFGVYIGRSHSGKGLGSLALDFAIAWCRLQGHAELMLSVHPSHAAAIHMYQSAGFQFSGASSGRGHDIYRKKLA